MTYSFRPHCGPWGGPSSYRNELQSYLLGVGEWGGGKDGQCVRLAFMCRLSRNSGGLNLLERTGLVEDSIGIVFPLPLFYLLNP